MNRQSMRTLIGLAREARDEAARLLAGDYRDRRQLTERMEVLERYRLEYQERLQAMLEQGIDPVTLWNYQDFLASLNNAIGQARDTLRVQDEKISRRRRDWQQEYLRYSSYDLLDERRKAQRQVLENRQEARRDDEIYNNIAVQADLGESPFNRRRN